jgi:phage internal scaffolding protein
MTRKHARVQKKFDAKKNPSLTKQSHKAECDVNTILKKYEKTGVINHVNNVAPTYGNFLNIEEYQTSLNKIGMAEESFDALPAKIRKKFQNNPANLIEFLSKEENKKEALELGLLNKPVEKEKIDLSESTINALNETKATAD